MPLRWQEAAIPLALVSILLCLKHLPLTQGLPLARLAGVVCFGYAIFLALRLIQPVEAFSVDGWDELRASPVEWFGAALFGVLSLIFLYLVLAVGDVHMPFRQMALAMALSIAFALIAGGIILFSILPRVRWNGQVLEQRTGFGTERRLHWPDVVGIKTHWRGITIWTRDGRTLSVSPYQAGAAQLARFAAQRIVRNARAEGAVIVS